MKAGQVRERSTGAGIAAARVAQTAHYLPATPVGHDLAVLENLLTSSVFGLFLLAIRRQYRR